MISLLILLAVMLALTALFFYMERDAHQETKRALRHLLNVTREQREREIDAARTGTYSLEQLEMERL